MANNSNKAEIYDGFRNYVSYGPPMKITRSVCQYVLVVSLLGLLSVFLYGTFYYSFVPMNVMKSQLHFQKSWTSKERALIDGSIAKTTLQTLHVEVPFPTDGSSFLNPGQQYSVSIDLHLADSEVNLNAGTFMISAHYYDKVEKLLTSSSRLVMLKYKSWLLRTLSTLAYSPLYLVGYLDESQVRQVELFRNYQENAFRPTALIVIDIDSPDLQLYEAQLVLQVRFSGLKYFMYYWPITTAVVFVSAIFLLLFSILFCSYLSVADNSRSTQSAHHKSAIQPTSSDAARKQDASKANPDREPPKRDSIRSSAVEGDSSTEPVTSLGVTDLDSKDTQNMAHIPTVRQRKLDPATDNMSSS